MFSFFKIFCDFAESWQLNFQDPSTPISEGINDLHHYINYFLIVIFFFVLICIINLFKHFVLYPSIFFTSFFNLLNIEKSSFANLFAVRFSMRFLKTIKKNHDYALEIIWTCIPSIILVLIAIPSFSLLYAMDEVINPAMSIKVIGRQWYWSYEYFDFLFKSFIEKINLNFSDFKPEFTFDSYMIPEDELLLGDLRLLEVDNPVVLPKNTHIRVIVTAGDVLHSWAVPSLGIKLDAVPGRLNQTSVFIKRLGSFYGQCSEICGTNHGFMPIVVQSLSLKDYISWFLLRLEDSF